MGIAPAAFSSLSRKISLARLGEIEDQFVFFSVNHLRTDRNPHDGIFTHPSMPVRAFAVFSAFRLVFGVVTQMKQRIQPFVSLKPHAATNPAIAARRPAAGNELLTSKRS